MPKDLNVSLLCDYYGDLLTTKQKEAILLYYNEDLSLAEIAEQLSITRQGARDNICRGEEKLLAFEKVLGMADKSSKLQETADDMQEVLDTMKASRISDETELGKMQNLIDILRSIL